MRLLYLSLLSLSTFYLYIFSTSLLRYLYRRSARTSVLVEFFVTAVYVVLPICCDWRKYLLPQVSILLIKGDLDLQTAVDNATDVTSNFRANTEGVNRYYVGFLDVPQSVLFQSPTTNYMGYSAESEHDFESLVDDPYAPLDTQWKDWMLRLDGIVSTNISKAVYKETFSTHNARKQIMNIPIRTMIEPSTTDGVDTYTVNATYNSGALLALTLFFAVILWSIYLIF